MKEEVAFTAAAFALDKFTDCQTSGRLETVDAACANVDSTDTMSLSPRAGGRSWLSIHQATLMLPWAADRM